MAKVKVKFVAGFAGKNQGGFTLLEATIAAGLSALVLVTLYVALGQGADVSRDVVKQQDMTRSLNNALIRFSDDMRSAVYFWAGTTTNDDNEEVLDPTPKPRQVTFVIPRTDKSLAWIKYELVTGVRTGDTYLIRLSDYEDPTQLELTYVAHDVANMLFIYYDAGKVETDDLREVAAVEMLLTIDTGVASKEQNYFVKLRNPNRGLLIPSYDFESERDSQLFK